MDKRVEIVNRATKAVQTSVARDGESRIPVAPNSNVKIVASPQSVTSMLREGDDLILRFDDGSSIRLEGYFNCPVEEIGQLEIDDPANGSTWIANLDAATCYPPADATSNPVTYTLTPLGDGASAGAAGSGLWIALGGLAAAGGIVAAASGGGGGGNDRGPTAPADTTPPAAPVVAPSRGTSITGTAEAGSSVRIDVNGDGSVEATVTAGADGSWTFTPATPIANGTAVSVVAVDAAGNVSAATRITVDSVAPGAPTIDPTTGATLAGTAEAGSTVLIDLNRDGTPDATVTAGADGRWTYTPATPLAEGTTVTVTARDAAGNISPPTTITLDFTAPPAGIGTVSDNTGAIQGPVTNGSSTDDTAPTLSGTTEPGAIISVYDGTTLLGTTTADGNGAWTFTPATPLTEGRHSLAVTATDAAGNVSAVSAPFVVTVDTAAPPPPTVNPSDGRTLSGTAEAGSTVTVDTNGDGTPDATTTAGTDGAWNVTLPAQLPDETVVSVVATDPAGNASPPATVTVDTGTDTTPPAVPVLEGLNDNAGIILGAIAPGGVTDDTAPTLTGTAEAAAVVSIYDGGTLLGTTTADANGAWTFTPPTALGEGPHSLTATATDATGNVSAATAPVTFTVDTVAPGTPTVAPSTGATLTGTAEAGSTVAIYDGATLVGSTQADAAGAWTFTPTTPIADGTTLTVIASDAAGNPSGPATLVVDAQAPLAPSILSVADDAPGGIGPVPTGGVSNDPTLTLSGSAEAGSLVIVYDGSTAIGTATADGTGAWTFTTPALPEGPHAFTATATDAAGNVSSASAVHDVTIDLTAPAAAVPGATDGTTLSGTAEPGASVLVDTNADGQPDATVPVDAAGNWTVTFSPPLADGTVVSVIAVDAAGNAAAAATATVSVAIDTTPPPVPTIGAVEDDVDPAQGTIASGAATNDATPTLTGTAEPGVLVSIYDGAALLGTTNADINGNWSFTAPVLADGPHSLTATTTDTAGNESQPSPAFDLTVDTAAPAAPSVAPSNGGTLTGTAEPGVTISIDLDGDGNADATSQADPTGVWSYTPLSPLGDGTIVNVTAVDAAGNVSPPASTTIDAAAPATPAIGAVTDDVGAIVGPVPDGGATDDTQPTLSGTTEGGATITVYDGNLVLGTAIADASGAWTFTPAAALAQGPHTFTVTSTDTFGNTGSPSLPFSIVVDTVAPGAPAITLVEDDAGPVSGAVAEGGVTDDTTPTVSGTAAPDSIVTVYANGTVLGTTTADALGEWTFTPSGGLAEGPVFFTATAADAAGNSSGQSNAYAVTIDDGVPGTPAITSAADDAGAVQGPVFDGGVTDDREPVLSGTADANASVTILQDGVAIAVINADALGNWSFPIAAPLLDGTYSYTAVSTGASGIPSATSAPFVLTVDTAAPGIPTIVSGGDDAGTIQTPLADGSTTDDILPTLSGISDPGATITILDNGSAIGVAVADGTGAWTFAFTAVLSEGPHVFTATATDAAGNASGLSAPFTLTVDITPPDVPTIDPSSGATLTGTANPNVTINIDLDGDGTVDDTTVSDGNGDWTYAPVPALPNGDTVIVTATDAAGNTSGSASTVIDASAPIAPVITAVADDFGPLTGTVPSGGTTDDTTPTVTGTAEPGSTVRVFDNGSPIGDVQVGANGQWTLPITAPLATGPHAFTAIATDAAGNPGPLSPAYDVAVDVSIPGAPTIDLVTDDAGAITGPVADNGSTDDALPTISGTGPANATITVYEGTAVLGTTTSDGTGAWSFTPTSPLPDGPRTFTATATNAAGNTGTASNAYTVTIDTAVPVAPTVTLVDDNVAGGVTGAIAPGGLTNDTTPTITGTAEPNSTVSVFIDDVFVATVPADGAGTWTYTPTLADGPHTITASSVNAAGNVSPVSAAFTFTVDGTAPAGALVNPTNGTGTLTGTAEPGATVSIDVGNDGGADTVSADPVTGAWSYAITPPAADGSQIAVTVIDAAGNSSAPTIVVVDGVAPGAPVLVAVVDDQGAVTGPIAPAGVTDDTLPAFSGTAEGNSLVTVRDGGVEIGTTRADPAGNWTFTPATPLGDGPHTITFTATDAAGNTGGSSPAFAFTVLTGLPAAPVIDSVTDDFGPQVGPVSGGGSTNDVTPLIQGTAQEGDIVTLFIDGVPQSTTVTAGVGGAFAFTPNLSGDGPYSFTVTATNAAGNSSPQSGAYAVTLDTVAPSAPALNPSDGTTVSGGAEPGAFVQLFVGGSATPAQTVPVDSFGRWSATFTPPLADGTGVTAFTVDAAGNVSGGNVTFVDINVPSTPPPTPVITGIADDQGTVQTPIVSGTITDDTAPRLSGTAAVGTVITIYDGATQIGTTNADGFGNWSITLPTPLIEGTHSLSATATLNGLESLNTTPISFTVDITAPPVPVIDPSNGTTLSGTAQAGAFVELDLDGDTVIDATVTAGPLGVWTYTPAMPLADATVVTAVARDVAGNGSPAATQTIDRAAPATPAITSASDDVAPGTGPVASGSTINDPTPTLTGTAEPGSTVSIFDGATLLGTAVATGGIWSFTVPTALGDGPHSFTVTATDGVGNVSGASPAYALTILTAAPAAPAITGADDDFGAIVGSIVNGGATNDATPTLSGTAEAGSTVSVFDGATLLGTAIVTPGGTWTYTPVGLGDGPHSLTAVATNAAGVTGPASAAFAFTVDTTAPALPVVTLVSDNAGTQQGPLASGAITDDGTPTLTGTAEAGATVSIFDGATLLGTAIASPAGAWTFTPATPLGTGPHTLTATATDAAGNQSAATPAFTLTVDTTAPVQPAITAAEDDVGAIRGPVANGGTTDDAAPLLSGTAEAGTIVSVFNNGALLGTTTATPGGTWSFTPPSGLPDGPHSFTVTSRDAAGNVSVASAAYLVTTDTVAPGAPAITAVTDDLAPQTGTLVSGGATNDPTPTLTGTAEAGSTVSIFDGSTLLGTAIVAPGGTWTFTPSAGLGEGNHSLTVRATDASGNQGPASAPFAIRVDTTGPLAPVIASVTDDAGTVVGPVGNGGVTNDTVPLLRGTAEAGTTLTVFANGSAIGTAQVDVAGNWNFSPGTALAEGTYVFTAAATDAAGNIGTTSATFTITVDTTAPAAPVITSIVDDAAPNTGVVPSGGLTNDAVPQLLGTAAANATVLVYDGGALLGSTTANGAGDWSFTPGTAIASGPHSFTAVAVDPAGNASGASNTYALVIDATPPTQTIAITTLTTDTGAQGDWSTQDTTPTVGGTLSATLGSGELVQVQIDGGAWVNATTNGNTWFYGAGTLATGPHTIVARVVDTAGNVGNSATQGLTITAIPPQAPIVQANGGSLLGLVGLEALNLIDLRTQSLSVVDPNNNLRSVVVRFGALLGLGAYTLTGSQAVAAELGLRLTVDNDPGFLGVGASSTLTITALNGGDISNLAINELLNTVHFQQSLLGVDLLGSTTITATDATSLTSSAATGNLLNVSLLNPAGSPNVIEGGTGADTLTGTGGNDRLYGHAGADIINAGGGDDFIRGGAGADTLRGEAGNDTLVYDAADALIDGGAGRDTLLIDTGSGPVLNLDLVNNIRNIEVINLGTGDAGRGVTLTEAGIVRATDANRTLTINGDSADSVTITGATLQGQTLINGEAYNHYTLGTTNIYVDHPVFVVV